MSSKIELFIVDNNECNNGNGGCQQVCNNFGGGFNCSCNSHFNLNTNGNNNGNATTCRASCATNPCQNGGGCTLNENALAHICNCTAGHDGEYCETASCDPNPCQNGGTCSIVGNSYKCACTGNFVGNNCQNQRGSLAMKHGQNAGDTEVNITDSDGCVKFKIGPCPIKVDGSYRNNIYICENGIVSFNGPYNGYSQPSLTDQLADFRSHVILAAYYTNLASRVGNIHFHQYTTHDLDRTENNDVKQTVLQLLSDASCADINISTVLVITWENVKEYGNSANNMSSFQMTIISDSVSKTLAFISYLDGYMQFTTTQNLIGSAFPIFMKLYNNTANPDTDFNNLGRLGFLWFNLNSGSTDTSVSLCRQCTLWVAGQQSSLNDLKKKWKKMPKCPCSKTHLTTAFQYLNSTFGLSADSNCSTVQPNGNKYGNQGSICCYNNTDNSFIANLGYKSKWNPAVASFGENYLTEKGMYDICCGDGDQCDQFNSVRPTNVCKQKSGKKQGGGTGDPHIVTLDGVEYTFNGEGEYYMTHMTTDDVDFVLQARTSPFLNNENKHVGATVFSAFAVRDINRLNNHEDVFMANLKENKTELEINANGKDWTTAFNNKTAPFIPSDDQNENIKLGRPLDNTLTVYFSNSDISLTITVKLNLLTMETIVPQELAEAGNPRGLLGNINGNVNDDFIARNGTQYPATSSERDLYEYGQTWIVTSATDSVFIYQPLAKYSDFQNVNAHVNFLDDANPEIVTNATVLCGVGNIPCIFDKVFIGRDDIAIDTKDVIREQEEMNEVLSNETPSLAFIEASLDDATAMQIHLTKGQTKTISLQGTDDGTITYKVLSGGDFIDLGTPDGNNVVDVNLTMTEVTPSTVSITVFDDKNVYAPALKFDIIFCTGCNNHGDCDFNNVRQEATSTNNFRLAVCTCDKYYQGDDCKDDFDGCAATPCSLGRMCTDNTIAEHISTEKAYKCSGCPDGYTLNTQNDVCEDDNECSQADTNACSDICTNTIGSYTCSCSEGHRATNDTTCIDINECDESTADCTQICTNTDPGYTCSCFDGYDYDSVSGTCNLTNEELCNQTGCTTTNGGCYFQDSQPVCFCNNGYKLEDDKSCTDIDECSLTICSQKCDNTEGSYTCSCIAGYQLNVDKTTCSVCPSGSWGVGCSTSCGCSSVGSSACNNAKGCVCDPGWTGTLCDEDVDECADVNICDDVLKVCVNTAGSYTCDCVQGYRLNSTSGQCEDYDECKDFSANPCTQVCSNNVGGYVCECNQGYQKLNDTHCQDIDECVDGTSGCEQVCENAIGSASCNCYFGYFLNDDRKTCRKAADKDVCAAASLTCSGYCIVGTDSAECACSPGYTLVAEDQQSCTDVNECDNSELNKCTDPTSCRNNDGGYICSCPTGQVLDNDGRTCKVCDDFHYGDDCVQQCNCGVGAATCDPVSGCLCKEGWTGDKCDADKNECDTETSPCTTDFTECVNTPGSYTCNCIAGYFLENDICEDKVECADPLLNDCSQKCTNTLGSFECSCNEGYTKNGSDCIDIDECSGIYRCDHICTNNDGKYKCTCRDGYRLDSNDRESCIPLTECSDEDKAICGLNSECSMINGNPSCDCLNGFEKVGSATNCTDILECTLSPAPCTQGCQDVAGGYTCSCNSGYQLEQDQKTCIECPQGSYGDSCGETCDCVEANTALCDTSDGTCTCKAGRNGTTCKDDINECTANPDPCLTTGNSSCVNTVGSFICQCDAGFSKLGDGSCQACDKTHFGTNCAQTCSCDVTNTELCVPATGQCNCKSGWTGDNCTDDVNECQLSPTPCAQLPQRTVCVNTNGSHLCNCDSGYELNDGDICIDIDECVRGTHTCDMTSEQCTDNDGLFDCTCKAGYQSIENDCIACPTNTWGDNCANTCTCDAAHSSECSASTGCVCDSGWGGADCSQDIDECTTNPNTCPEYSNCKNTVGDFECTCWTGYIMRLSSRSFCEACSNDKYGVSCNTPCDCEGDHTFSPQQTCHHVTGVCDCTWKWNGSRCEQDVDECATGFHSCKGDNEGCYNTQGGHECSCTDGYKRDNNSKCVAGPPTTTTEYPLPATFTLIRIEIIFNHELAVSIDLTLYKTLAAFKVELTRILKLYYEGKMPGINIEVIVHRLEKGSLLVDYSVVVPTTSLVDLTIANAEIASGDNITVFGDIGQVQNMTIQNSTVATGVSATSTTQLCQVYFATVGSCGSGQQCSIIDGKPACEPLETDDNLSLILGLGIGIPLFLLAALVIALVVIYLYKRRETSEESEDEYSPWKDSQYPAPYFTTQIPIRSDTTAYSDGGGVYRRTTDSEAGYSEAFVDTQIYDNRPHYPKDQAYPANFSWDFMFTDIDPDRTYEIKRPKVDPVPRDYYL